MKSSVDFLTSTFVVLASDPTTGLISTNRLLDREAKDKYKLLLVIQDQGEVPQQATRELLVQLEDVDDHKPVFKRALVSKPSPLFNCEQLV